ncbi:DUF6635 family protein [Bdellovibrio reynosensis]|uniref:Uncharacterized protein n=1 Tax=Bdellovibrio reynosensis TaxID=2835041 RepID=A0ABY4C7N3_9BACT|nr:DUF6635 family protein [Bdellovibrio reynosensis]UOF00942.1 hypothetical protein MNR06_14670 [Bdellovibrio reynosensis]
MPERSALILGALEECISEYVEEKRACIDSFISNQYSMQATLDVQKKVLALDLLLNPLNSLWSIPYLTIKKIVETLEQVGWTALVPFFEVLPSGIKTAYQRHIEKQIQTEFLGFGGKYSERDSELFKKIQDHKVLGPLLEKNEISLSNRHINLALNKEVEKYCANQNTISDLLGSFITLGTGWYFFGKQNLSVSAMGDQMARKWAHDDASTKFIFGKKAGSAFYNLFPPQPTGKDIFIATVIIGALLMIVTTAVTVASDPVRLKLGLHRKRISILLDKIEESLFTQLKKQIKRSYKESKAA